MLAGAALNLVCIGIALSGVTIAHFWWALVLLGVGWNFLYIGGTTLLTETYRPGGEGEGARSQRPVHLHHDAGVLVQRRTDGDDAPAGRA